MVLAMTSAFATFLAGCADKIILHPQTGCADPCGAECRTTPFQDGELEIWTARSPGAVTRPVAAYVLSFVGNAARAEWSATADAMAWADRPVEVWEVNHPGYGGSTGPARLDRLAPAGLAAYDALAKKAAGRPIIVAGTSLGSAVALHVAAHRPAAGMLLRNPPPLRQLILGEHGWWNLWLAASAVAMSVPPELDSLANAAAVRAPAVFMLAEHDEIVPPRYQAMVVDAYGGAKSLVELDGAFHNSPMTDAAQERLGGATAWLWAKVFP